MVLEEGKLLSKRYQILALIGSGETNCVYHATDVRLNTDVAVKERRMNTEAYARQFRLEAAVLEHLRHPSLPRVIDYITTNDSGEYIVMDYIDGEDLQQRLRHAGNFEESDAISLGMAVCDVLTHLHTSQPSIIHRNIKPSVIRITPEGKIFLVGFGLVKVLHSIPAPGLGSPYTDARTDIYSLSATLYTLLSSTVPEDSLNRAMAHDRLTPLVKLNPGISHSLGKVIEKAMAIEPRDRFQSSEEFKKALLKCTRNTGQKKGHRWLSWLKK
jgi:eukaryotic-like serine/threonine-protein kinase